MLVEAEAGGERGLGYSYADTATAVLVRDLLSGVVAQADVLDVAGPGTGMVRAIRNVGRPGIFSRPPAEYPLPAHAQSFFSHLVHGATTDAVSRLLRNTIGG